MKCLSTRWPTLQSKPRREWPGPTPASSFARPSQTRHFPRPRPPLAPLPDPPLQAILFLASFFSFSILLGLATFAAKISSPSSATPRRRSWAPTRPSGVRHVLLCPSRHPGLAAAPQYCPPLIPWLFQFRPPIALLPSSLPLPCFTFIHLHLLGTLPTHTLALPLWLYYGPNYQLSIVPHICPKSEPLGARPLMHLPSSFTRFHSVSQSFLESPSAGYTPSPDPHLGSPMPSFAKRPRTWSVPYFPSYPPNATLRILVSRPLCLSPLLQLSLLLRSVYALYFVFFIRVYTPHNACDEFPNVTIPNFTNQEPDRSEQRITIAHSVSDNRRISDLTICTTEHMTSRVLIK